MGRPAPLLLVFLLLITGCATTQSGRATSRVVGALVLAGTEQPIVGARVTLTPLEPLHDARRPDETDVEPARLSTIATTADLGAFVLTELNGPAGPMPLLRGWAYELRADADGFYSSVERIELSGSEVVMLLQIEVIDEEAMLGQQLTDLPADAVKVERGGLIKEVLRRLGR